MLEKNGKTQKTQKIIINHTLKKKNIPHYYFFIAFQNEYTHKILMI